MSAAPSYPDGPAALEELHALCRRFFLAHSVEYAEIDTTYHHRAEVKIPAASQTAFRSLLKWCEFGNGRDLVVKPGDGIVATCRWFPKEDEL